jgi:hypothetical protein
MVVGYPRYLFSLPILASSAFQNVPYSYFIIFMLVAQAFAVGGPGMLMAWYMTIILAFGEGLGRISGHHLAWAVYHKGPIITIWSLKPLEFRGCCQLISALTKK